MKITTVVEYREWTITCVRTKDKEEVELFFKKNSPTLGEQLIVEFSRSDLDDLMYAVGLLPREE